MGISLLHQADLAAPEELADLTRPGGGASMPWRGSATPSNAEWTWTTSLTWAVSTCSGRWT